MHVILFSPTKKKNQTQPPPPPPKKQTQTKTSTNNKPKNEKFAEKGNKGQTPVMVRRALLTKGSGKRKLRG